jgi:hypothetical protein
MAELAVLTVIARQCQRAGVCTLHIDAIAALAGCSRTTVQNTLRQGRLEGLILVRERRIPGLPSLTNIVSIVSKEWTVWLRLGGCLTIVNGRCALNSSQSISRTMAMLQR